MLSRGGTNRIHQPLEVSSRRALQRLAGLFVRVLCSCIPTPNRRRKRIGVEPIDLSDLSHVRSRSVRVHIK